MSIIAKEEKTYEPIPTGMQQAVCAMVCDIGTHEGEYQGKPNTRHQVIVIWELDEKKTEGDFAGQPFQVSKFYTTSLGEKANLRKDLESWRGQPFTPEELKGFDLENLVGANCFLNLIQDGEKVKISAITPLPKNMPKIKQAMREEPEWVDKQRAKSIERTKPGAVAKGSPAAGPPLAADGEPLPF